MLGDRLSYINVIYELDFEPRIVLTSSGPISRTVVMGRIFVGK